MWLGKSTAEWLIIVGVASAVVAAYLLGSYYLGKQRKGAKSYWRKVAETWCVKYGHQPNPTTLICDWCNVDVRDVAEPDDEEEHFPLIEYGGSITCLCGWAGGVFNSDDDRWAAYDAHKIPYGKLREVENG